MALKLTFKQTDNGETLRITEASTDGTDLTGATLTITWAGTDYSIALSGDDWTDTDSSLDWSTTDTIDVTADDVGGTSGDKFTDGLYTVVYDATNEDAVTYTVLLDYNVRYCVFNILRLLPDVHNSRSACTNKCVWRAIFMYTYLKALELAASAGQTSEISRVLLSLQNLCRNPYIDECYSS